MKRRALTGKVVCDFCHACLALHQNHRPPATRHCRLGFMGPKERTRYAFLLARRHTSTSVSPSHQQDFTCRSAETGDDGNTKASHTNASLKSPGATRTEVERRRRPLLHWRYTAAAGSAWLKQRTFEAFICSSTPAHSSLIAH